MRNPTKIGSFVFNLCFGEFNLIYCIAQVIWLLEQITTNGGLCLFVAEMLPHCALDAAVNLIVIAAIGKQLLCVKETWNRSFVSLSSCVYRWLYKAVETFLRGVVNKTVFSVELEPNSR